MAFRRDAFYDAYDCGADCRQCVVANNPTDGVMVKAVTDAESILELAVRCATGCAAPFEPEAATLFADVALKRHGAYERVESLFVSDQDHHKVHAAASLAFLIKYRQKDTAGTLFAYLEDPDLLHAVVDANAAIKHKLRFPGAFEVADVVLQLGEAHDQDVRGGARFGEYKYLWKAYNVRQRVLEKVDQAPYRYTCPAPSCAFRSLKACLLRRCAGACPPEVKPSYCSKERQRRVRAE
ncbi:hypothetical protein C8T65DRAFT_741805 [Cerioporus squamosus]|nr:hypothetical protein C8T65DRAFT_741805 [Cerioporus squamosus]